jgi:hypothetical protein
LRPAPSLERYPRTGKFEDTPDGAITDGQVNQALAESLSFCEHGNSRRIRL